MLIIDVNKLLIENRLNIVGDNLKRWIIDES